MRTLAALAASLVLVVVAYAGCTLNTRGNAADGAPQETAASSAGASNTSAGSSSSSSGGGSSIATSSATTGSSSSAGAGGAGTGGAGGGGGGGGCGDVNNDPNNCGQCGLACAKAGVATRLCVNGVCRPECDPGKLDCDIVANNGCETDAIDDQNCGVCGNDCTAITGSCTKDKNIYRCACSLQSNCGPAAKCESEKCKCYPAGNPGHHCSYGEYCPSGNTCTCNGLANCDDTILADGLEHLVCCPSGCADLRNDNTNCGACSKACPMGVTCTNGLCL